MVPRWTAWVCILSRCYYRTFYCLVWLDINVCFMSVWCLYVFGKLNLWMICESHVFIGRDWCSWGQFSCHSWSWSEALGVQALCSWGSEGKGHLKFFNYFHCGVVLTYLNCIERDASIRYWLIISWNQHLTISRLLINTTNLFCCLTEVIYLGSDCYPRTLTFWKDCRVQTKQKCTQKQNYKMHPLLPLTKATLRFVYFW